MWSDPNVGRSLPAVAGRHSHDVGILREESGASSNRVLSVHFQALEEGVLQLAADRLDVMDNDRHWDVVDHSLGSDAEVGEDLGADEELLLELVGRKGLDEGLRIDLVEFIQSAEDLRSLFQDVLSVLSHLVERDVTRPAGVRVEVA